MAITTRIPQYGYTSTGRLDQSRATLSHYFNYDYGKECLFITIESLMDREVPPDMREKFWCKYGSDLCLDLTEKSEDRYIADCPVLAGIVGWLYLQNGILGDTVRFRNLLSPNVR